MRVQFKKIKTNDFPKEHKELAEKLGNTLNPMMDQLEIAFNKNINVDDNIPFEFKTVDMIVDVNGIPENNEMVTTTLKTFKGYICINALNLENTGTYPTATPFLSTSFDNLRSVVTIQHISGLPTGVKFRLYLLGIS